VAQVLETAIILPAVMMLTLGTCSAAMGIYYYQLVATLAREVARYASVHGGQYFQDTGNSVTAGQMASALGLNLNNLTYQVQWGTAVSGSWVWTDWVSSSSSPPTSYNPNSVPPGEPQYNLVQVTVTCQWTPDLYITGPLNLTSTSVMPMSY
jgi:Flp pilus assembly protein TadG